MKKILSIFAVLLLALTTYAPEAFAEMRRDRAVATYVTFWFRNAVSGALISGASGIDCEISKFKNTVTPPAFVDATNSESEVGSSGVYRIMLNASEMNSRFIVLKCTSSTGNAVPYVDVINTEPYPPPAAVMLNR